MPEERQARTSAARPWVPVAAFVLMLAAGAALPTWWLAVAAILPIAIVLQWTLMAPERR
jgi:hypothetical protein